MERFFYRLLTGATKQQSPLRLDTSHIIPFICLRETLPILHVELGVTQFCQLPFSRFQRVRLSPAEFGCGCWRLYSQQKTPANSRISEIQPTNVPCLSSKSLWTAQSWNDNSRNHQVSRWSPSTSSIWTWPIYCWLPRTSMASCSSPRMVSEVSPCFCPFNIETWSTVIDVQQHLLILMNPVLFPVVTIKPIFWFLCGIRGHYGQTMESVVMWS